MDGFDHGNRLRYGCKFAGIVVDEQYRVDPDA
jgi:hypothetical protein